MDSNENKLSSTDDCVDNIRTGNLYCPYETCGNSYCNPSSQVIVYSLDTRLYVANCSRCNGNWYLCRLCSTTTFPLRTLQAVKCHMTRRHPIGKNPAKKRKKRIQPNIPHDNEQILNIEQKNDTNFKNEMQSDLLMAMETSIFDMNSSIIVGKDEEIDNSSYNSNGDNANKTTMNFQSFLNSQINYNYNSLVNTNLNDVSSAFFSHECDDSSGIKFLVTKSYHKADINMLNIISLSEANFHMTLANFVRNLKSSQVDDFSNVLALIYELYVQQPNKISLVCDLPTNTPDMRRYYMDAKLSVSNNIPRPLCKMLNNHSIVSITDCISDCLAHGECSILSFEKLQQLSEEPTSSKYDSLCNSIVLKSIINDTKQRLQSHPVIEDFPIINIFIILWSDDFEPNNSIKSNRQSAWIITCTFIIIQNNHQLFKSTYPLPIGYKGHSHKEMYNAIFNDLKCLKSGNFIALFSGYYKSPAYIHAELLAVVNDQPERRSSLAMSGGNSTFHSRFSYSCDYTKTILPIVSCLDCYNHIEKEYNEYAINNKVFKYNREWRSNKCHKCYNWLLDESYGGNDYMFVVDNDFPSSECNNKREIAYSRLTFKKLRDCVSYVHDSIISGKFNKKQATSYLKFHCMNDKTINEIIFKGYNCHLLQVSIDSKIKDPLSFEVLDRDNNESSDLYTIFEVPIQWECCNSFNTFVEAPMHLLFLGITKVIMIDIQMWLKLSNHGNSFYKLTTGILEPIQAIRVEWCKVLAFSNTKFGGWVSENYLGFSRLMLWFYSLLRYVPSPVTYIQPTTEQRKWSRKQNEDWLKNHGEAVKGNAKEIQELVSKLMNLEEPPVLIVSGKCCPVEHVLKLLSSLVSMLSICMSLDVTDDSIFNLTTCIQYFLSNYCIFVKSMDDSHSTNKKKKVKASYIRHYNFMSLLNLPNQMKHYGSLRLLWEGGTQGEGYLRSVKGELKKGLNKNWPKWLMDSLLVDKGYNTVMGKINNKDNLLSSVIKDIKVYKNKAQAESILQLARPFSAIKVLDDNDAPTIYICYRNHRKIMGIEIATAFEQIDIYGNLKYYKVDYKENNKSRGRQIDLDGIKYNKLIPLLFLPELCITGYPRRDNIEIITYAIVKSDWS